MEGFKRHLPPAYPLPADALIYQTGLPSFKLGFATRSPHLTWGSRGGASSGLPEGRVEALAVTGFVVAHVSIGLRTALNVPLGLKSTWCLLGNMMVRDSVENGVVGLLEEVWSGSG